MFLSLLVGSALAGDYSELGAPFIRNFDPKDYRAHRQNWAVVQDHRGLMYFANGDGVLEFDGENWRLIILPNQSLVRSLVVDAHGVIFVGAVEEFGFLAPNASGLLEYVTLTNKLAPLENQFKEIWDVHATSHGVYFRSRRKIFRYFGGEIEVIPMTSRLHSFVMFDALLVFNQQSGLSVIDGTQIQRLPHTKNFHHDLRNPRLYITPMGGSKILMGTKFQLREYDLAPFLKKGRFRPDIEQMLDGVPQPRDFKTGADGFFAQNRISCLLKISEDRFALGTKKAGIVIIDANGDLVQIINRASGLFRNKVRALYLDRHKNLWVAFDHGIAHVQVSAPMTVFDEHHGLEEAVLSITRHDDNLFVGSFSGTHILSPAKINRHQNARFEPVEGAEENTWDFFSKDDLLLACSKTVLAIQNGRARETNFPRFSFCFGASKRFPDVLFLGHKNGLSAVTLETSDQQGETPQESESPSVKVRLKFRLKGIGESIRQITSDSFGNLWVKTGLHGLIYVKFPSEKLEEYQVFHYDLDHGLPRLSGASSFVMDDRVFAHTEEGIFGANLPAVFPDNPAEVTFVPKPHLDSLSEQSSICGASKMGDPSSWVWTNVQGEVGFYHRNVSGDRCWEDVPFKKLGYTVFFQEPNGITWLGTSNGLFRYDPKIGKDYQQPFDVLIRKVTTGGSDLLFGGYRAIPRPTGHAVEGVSDSMTTNLVGGEIEYENNAVSFEFTSNFYEHSEDNQFRYSLEGFDRKWSDWSGETSAVYTNLPGGKYRFMVKAKNIYGQESSTHTFIFSIAFPWYRTIFAYSSYAFIILLLFVVGIKLNTRRLTRTHLREKQQAQIRQEVQKFEALGRLAGGIAHDFNKILSSVLGFSSLAKKEVSQNSMASMALGEIAEAGERGKDLIDEILTFARRDKPIFKPMNVYQELVQALKLAKISFPPGVQVIENLCPDAGWIMGDKTKFHQIVLNLCQNAVHALQGDSRLIELGLKRHSSGNIGVEDSIQFWIRDHGMGMDEKTMGRIFEPFYTTKKPKMGTGLGLSVVHSIVKAMGGQIEVSSELGRGSRFEVQFRAIEWPQLITVEPEKNRGIEAAKRIWWIDDDPSTLRQVVPILRQQGFYASGSLLKDVASTELPKDADTFEMVFLHVEKYVAEAKRLIALIMRVNLEFPVVVFSGHSSMEAIDQKQKVGIHLYRGNLPQAGDLGPFIQSVLNPSPNMSPRRNP